MQDTLTAKSPAGLIPAVCHDCGRIIYVSGEDGSFTDDTLTRAGWVCDQVKGPICDLCLEREPWTGADERQAFATALAAEDKAPKQTQAEAAQAYDAETVERAVRLLIDLSAAGRITGAAFDLGAEVLGVLKCAVNHPGLNGWGANCRGERGPATNEEAL